MPKFEMLVRPCSVIAVAFVLPFATAAVPAQAQDIFGFFRALTSPVAPVPAYQPFEYSPGPAIERPRKARARQKPVPVEQAAIETPVKPRPPGEIANPFPAVLADSTLRPGDMVMFPDGLRVFTGRSGGQHNLVDFVPLSRAGKAVPRTTRKLVANLHPGENTAWSADGLRSSGKLAVNAGDVQATGSVSRIGSRGGFRTR
jgi:hypothetical protein